MKDNLVWLLVYGNLSPQRVKAIPLSKWHLYSV